MYKFWLFCVCICLFSCDSGRQYHKFAGETMGTYYAITYQGVQPQQLKEEIDELLIGYNNSLSTYIPTSFISKLNKSETGTSLPDEDKYFAIVLKRANELKKITNGKLNTGIMPLLRYWRDNSTSIDSTKSNALRKIVLASEFDMSDIDDEVFVSKSLPESELDFSSLAKGYGIDVISEHLEAKGIENYLVDIGGEARAKGMSKSKTPWKLAINKPIEGAGLTEMELVVSLSDQSIATSGSYRQFYEKDGKKIAHIMDPKTGYSTTSDLLSATVIADDCMTADGIATALMVSSLEEAKRFLIENKYAACLIYDANGDTKFEKFYANGFDEIVLHSK